jgi:hypothetical protein
VEACAGTAAFDRMNGKVTLEHNAHVQGNLRLIVNFPDDDD